MLKVGYIPLGNILADDPLSRMSWKGWILNCRGGCQFTFFSKFTLAPTVHERNTLATLVSYKHNVAAKHGSCMPLTTNELWLLELWIKSTPILASIPDALWDMCKSSIVHTFSGKLKQYALFNPADIKYTIQNTHKKVQCKGGFSITLLPWICSFV